MDVAQKRIDELQAEKDILQRQAREWSERYCRSESLVAEKETKIDELQAENDSLRENLEEWNERGLRSESLVGEKETKINQLNQALNEASRVLAMEKGGSDRLTAQLKDLQNTYDDALAQLRFMRTMHEDLLERLITGYW